MQVNQVSSVKVNPSFGYKMNKNTVKFLDETFGTEVLDAFKKSNGNDVKFKVKESLGVYWAEVSKGKNIVKTDAFLSNDFVDFKNSITLNKVNKLAQGVIQENQKKGFLSLFFNNK